jgi:acyl-CoA synthetase (AMP-forming)/AMP-acid ligase II
MTLVRRLLDQAAAAPAEVALVAGDGAELTYGELRRRVLAVRHGLLDAGLAPGDLPGDHSSRASRRYSARWRMAAEVVPLSS